jgi:hypothetical protein
VPRNKPLTSRTAPKDRTIRENRANYGMQFTNGYKVENNKAQKLMQGDNTALSFVRGDIEDKLHHIIPLETISLILDHAKSPDDIARLNSLFRDELKLNLSSNPKGTMYISKPLHDDVHRHYRELGVQPSPNNKFIQNMGINKLLTKELVNPTIDELEIIAREYLPYAASTAKEIIDDAYLRQDQWRNAIKAGRKARSMYETEGMENTADKFAEDKLNELISLIKQESGRDSRIDSDNTKTVVVNTGGAPAIIGKAMNGNGNGNGKKH